MIALPRASAAAPPGSQDPGGRAPQVAIWLFVVAAFVYLMVVVGGATRLTGSGLSITEWRPVTGALPPLSQAAWAEAFAKYRASSQYRLINQGISLGQFQILFWWEWAHRLLGRSVGLVFFLPFAVFLALRKIPRLLILPCVGLFALGGLQGLVGWWMVQSGLEGRAAVAPERLATHLGLALFLLASLVWVALDAWNTAPSVHPAHRRSVGVRGLTLVFGAGVYLQCLMGALVAGNGAGLIDGDWPLMAGRLFPVDYWHGGVWETFGHGRSAVQFNHRVMAYGLLVLGAVPAVVRGRGRAHARLTFVLLVLQAGLGVSALLYGDPLWLALLHQANAALVLIAATVLVRRTLEE